jgi:hypothetical protein
MSAQQNVIDLYSQPLQRLAYRAMPLKKEELLAPAKLPKLVDHTLSAVRRCLFNILTATLYTLEAALPIHNLKTRHVFYTNYVLCIHSFEFCVWFILLSYRVI